MRIFWHKRNRVNWQFVVNFGAALLAGYTGTTMLTKHKMRLALMRVVNVSDFCRKYELARRTVMRMRSAKEKGEASPTRRTLGRIERALISEGIISDEQQQPAKPQHHVARRKLKKLG